MKKAKQNNITKSLSKVKAVKNKAGSSGGRRLSSISAKRKTKKDHKARRKAEYRATLPKSRVKRIFYRLHPKRLYQYWFSREGLVMGLKLAGTSIVLMAVFVVGIFAYFRKDLPDPKEINTRILSQSTKFYDRTGEHLLFEVYGDENRTVVDFDEISDPVKWATVAVEDKDFYDHGGVSFRGVLRAAWSNISSGDSTGQGGSTITQQFIKNSLLTTDQTYTRKIQEIILALEMERQYSKDQILSFYLNEIPYGPQEYGIQAAAKSFFSKDAKQLGISEAAILAALPQAPTYYSPYGEHTDDLIDRQHIIIDLMRDQGFIDAETAEKAKEVDVLARITPIAERSLYSDIFAPHFVLEVQNQLEEIFGASLVQTGGLKVITTLDYDLQKIAEKAVKDADNDGFCDRSGRCGDNAAIVATDVETGHVTAMVGSRDFNYPGYGSFNAALAERQPGSSFKPFDYAQLFYNDRWGPDSSIYDTPTTWGSYQPKNFDFGYNGRIKVREALGQSRNIPAVKAIDIARPENVVGLAIEMGNKALADDATYPNFDLSYGLGAGEVKLAEHAHAYATFARGGVYLPQTYIISVENADGDELLKWEKEPGEQVLDEQIAYLVTDMLRDDRARSRTFGLGNSNLVVPGLNHTVKTGSTDRSVDGLMMGYTADMSVGVWVGNADNSPMDSLTSHQTGPIFTQFLKEATAKKGYDLQKEILARPEGIKTIRMDADTGYAATDKTKNTYVGIFPSWYKPETAENKIKYTIDKVSGLKATECTPERAKEEKTGSALWPEVLENDYRFSAWSRTAGYGGIGGGPKEEDDVHKCSDVLPSVSIDTNKISAGVYEITANASKGTFPLEELNIKINGQIVSSFSVKKSPDSFTYTHTFSEDGSYNISAEIIDEGLYDNTSSTNLSVSGAGQSIGITSHSDGAVNVDPLDTFSWSELDAANNYNFCYKLSSEANFNCLNTAKSTSYSPGLSSASSYDVKVQANVGGGDVIESPTISVVTQ